MNTDKIDQLKELYSQNRDEFFETISDLGLSFDYNYTLSDNLKDKLRLIGLSATKTELDQFESDVINNSLFSIGQYYYYPIESFEEIEQRLIDKIKSRQN